MQDHCANCEGENIVYSDNEKQGNTIGYYYTCQDCYHDGVEWYIYTEVYKRSE